MRLWPDAVEVAVCLSLALAALAVFLSLWIEVRP